MNVKLIDNFKEAWKFSSVRLASILPFLSELYNHWPEIEGYVPTEWVSVISVVLILARVTVISRA